MVALEVEKEEVKEDCIKKDNILASNDNYFILNAFFILSYLGGGIFCLTGGKGPGGGYAALLKFGGGDGGEGGDGGGA
jgi:hypothetical protein